MRTIQGSRPRIWPPRGTEVAHATVVKKYRKNQRVITTGIFSVRQFATKDLLDWWTNASRRHGHALAWDQYDDAPKCNAQRMTDWFRPQLTEIDRMQKQRRFDGSQHDERITDLQLLIVHQITDGRVF